MIGCKEDKESFGSQPSPTPTGHQNCPMESRTAEVNLNSERADSDIGSVSSTSSPRSPSPLSRHSFLRRATMSLADPLRRMRMSGRRRPGYPTLNSSSVLGRLDEIVPPTGRQYGISLSEESSNPFQQGNQKLISIRISNYNALRKIRSDFGAPVAMERQVFVFWGTTGTGKSRRAWDEASLFAYPKSPSTKFWDGYQNQEVF